MTPLGAVPAHPLGAGRVTPRPHPLGRLKGDLGKTQQYQPSDRRRHADLINRRIDLSLRDQGFVCPSSTDTVSQRACRSLSHRRVNGRDALLGAIAKARGRIEDLPLPSAQVLKEFLSHG